jgi:5,5'-dehydrodivanillate O-demethylase
VPNDRLLQLTSAQDYVAAVGQGAIADREGERLGASDKGIVFLRRLFWRELDAIARGADAKTWCRLDTMPAMPRQRRG